MLNTCIGMHNIIFPMLRLSLCSKIKWKCPPPPPPWNFPLDNDINNDIGLRNILNILATHPSVQNLLFTSATALVIYVSKLPLGACSIRACSISKLRKWIWCLLPNRSVFYSSFSDSPSTKLLPKFRYCVRDVGEPPKVKM